MASWADELRSVVVSAAEEVGLDGSGAEPIRFSDNAVFRLPGQAVVVRVAPATPSAPAAAAKQVRVSAWLPRHSLPVVRAVGADQPVEARGRVVTFWHEIDVAGEGEYPQVGRLLRRLHALPIPAELELPAWAPVGRLSERIDAAVTLASDDRDWLHRRKAELEERYRGGLAPGRPHCVVHGNPSVDNAVTTADGGAVLMDLDGVAVGPPEWDLTTIAVDMTTFGSLSPEDYATVASLQGHRGPRPWGWQALL